MSLSKTILNMRMIPANLDWLRRCAVNKPADLFVVRNFLNGRGPVITPGRNQSLNDDWIIFISLISKVWERCAAATLKGRHPRVLRLGVGADGAAGYASEILRPTLIIPAAARVGWSCTTLIAPVLEWAAKG